MSWKKSGSKPDKTLQKAAQHLGYYNDLNGIINRFIREEGNWTTHLTNCKNYIIKNTAGNHAKKSCAVLGSGWLLDLPIEFLAKSFDKVFLVDIHHPRQILAKVKKYPNIEMIVSDLSGGGIEWFYNKLSKPKKLEQGWLKKLKLSNGFFYSDFDFVISLNILNQLDILLIDYMMAKIKSPPEAEDIAFARKMIQENHIASLPKGKSCLITDWKELNESDNGLINIKELIFAENIQLNNSETWKWKFDTHKTYHNHCNTIFKVVATTL